MKSILTRLYEGDIYPLEQCMPKSEVYCKIREDHRRRNKDFQEKLEALDPALLHQFIKIMDDLFAELPFEASEAFINGFCLGSKMMVEIYQNEF